jgi:hypothetical protein
MPVLRTLLAFGTATAAFAAAPASAQFYFEPYNVRGTIVTGAEPGMLAQDLTGATPVELRAALVWNLRAALNVAALQCQFEPTLMTLQNYNALLGDHAEELKTSYDTLTKYFVRTAKSAKAGQTALDQYGTRVYSSFSTVAAQRIFCQTAGEIGHAALWTPRGSFGTLAQERMGEMRRALVPWGEQRFRARPTPPPTPRLPRLEAACWKRNEWQVRRCGIQDWWG